MTVIKRELFDKGTTVTHNLSLLIIHQIKKGVQGVRQGYFVKNNDCKNNDPYAHQTMNLHFVQKTYTPFFTAANIVERLVLRSG